MAKMQTTNVITGAKEELGAGSLISKFMWVIVTTFIIAGAQNAIGWISSKSKLDGQIEPFVKTPMAPIAVPMGEVI